MDALYIAVVASLVVVVLARVAFVAWQPQIEPTPAEAGYLAGGPRRAIVTVLAVLRRRGAVAAGEPGTVTRAKPPHGDVAPMERAVYGALFEPPVGPRALGHRVPVARALATARGRLVAGGLLLSGWRWALLRTIPVAVVVLDVVHLVSRPADTGSWLAASGTTALAVGSLLLPRRTPAGSRTLHGLRRNCPPPVGDEPLPPEETGMVVAVHGRLDLPGIAVFADRAGLHDGGRWPRSPAADAKNYNETWARGGVSDGAP